MFLTSQTVGGVPVADPPCHFGDAHCQRTIPISAATTRIVILARDPLVAALVGMLLEVDAYEPVFPRPDESPEEAVRRIRPALVVLLASRRISLGWGMLYVGIPSFALLVIAWADVTHFDRRYFETMAEWLGRVSVWREGAG